MNEIKLLPCPICGEEALECKTKVICSKCTCTVYGRNINIARKLWNTRKPIERIAERVHDITKVYLDARNPEESAYVVRKMDVINIVKEEGGTECVVMDIKKELEKIITHHETICSNLIGGYEYKQLTKELRELLNKYK